VALALLEKKIFKDLASFRGFSLPVRKIFRVSEPFEQIIKRPTQGTFLPKISFLSIIVSENKIFKEMLTHMRNAYAYAYELPSYKVRTQNEIHSDLKTLFYAFSIY
jgi:hypothetical protein